MFKKILVVEDLDSIVYGIAMMLQKEVAVQDIVMSQYCDDAYLKFLKAEQEETPFDLLITDLSFKEDHRESKINSGEELITAVRMKNSVLPVIVYSIEDRPTKVRRLFEKYDINGYVVKGRNGLTNMLSAVKVVYGNSTYISPELITDLQRKEIFEVDEYDVTLLLHLSEGLTQDQVAHFFKENGIVPSSISSIEKRLNRLKLQLQAKNTIQLVANAKDMGLI